MIALLTDFGTKDNYTAVMKGVIKNINKKADIIDLTHCIDPQDITQAAFVLQNSYKYFPIGTLFTVVVDPGVGSARKIILVETDNYKFLAPDNGVLSQIYKKEMVRSIINVNNEELFLRNISNTFHGRDIFAPVSGHIDNQVNINELGEKLSLSEIEMKNFEPEILSPVKLKAKVIDIDRFGNLLSNFNLDEMRSHKINNIKIKGHQFSELAETFSDVSPGETLAYKGSSGFLEFALRNGNISEKFGIDKKEEIHIKLKGKS